MTKEQAAAASIVAPNIQAELGLLSQIIADGNVYSAVSDRLRAEHFGEPLHQAIYAATGSLITEGLQVSPATLRARIETHPSYPQVGGDSYLVRLQRMGAATGDAGSLATAVLENYARRSSIALAETILRDATTSPMPIAQIVERGVNRLQSITDAVTGGTAQKFKHTFAEAVSEAIDLSALAYQYMGQPPNAVMTGLNALDGHLGGFGPGDLVVVAGRPAMGKTALAATIGFNVASRKEPRTYRTLFFSLEMPAAQIATRQIAAAINTRTVSYGRIAKGKISEEEFGDVVDAGRRIKDVPFDIIDRGSVTLSFIEAQARRVKAENPELALVVVDYLQLVNTADLSDNRSEAIGKVTATFKRLARELGVVFIALSQLSRGVDSRDDKRPIMSDLRESGSIEQDADCILFCYRENYYLARKEPRPNTNEHIEWTQQMEACAGKMDIIVGKSRTSGTASVRVNADLAVNKIFDEPKEQVEMFQ